MTKFKTAAAWGADPMKGVATKVKSAFTRSFNQAGLPLKCTTMAEDYKRVKGGKEVKGKAAPKKKKAAAAPADDDGIGGEIAEVRRAP